MKQELIVLTPKRWVESTNAIGIVTKGGRYAATYAHKDIAFEFASWISPEFKLYIIEDYQRLKEGENARLSLGWNLNREISKLNYRVHTDSIKENIRDSATIYQLLVLANMESYNAILIKQGKIQADRMHLLHELAVQQMTTLSSLELSNLPGIEKK